MKALVFLKYAPLRHHVSPPLLFKAHHIQKPSFHYKPILRNQAVKTKSPKDPFKHKINKLLSEKQFSEIYSAFESKLKDKIPQQTTEEQEDKQKTQKTQIDASVITQVLHTFAEHGQLEHAAKLLQLFVAKPPDPSASLLALATVFFRNYFKKNPDIRTLIETFKKYNLQLDVFGYFLVLKECARRNLLEDAEFVIQEMNSAGVKQNTLTYNVLLGMLVNLNRFEDTIRLADEMRSEGVPLDAVSYATLMKAMMLSGDVDSLKKLYLEMQENNVQLEELNYRNLILGLIQASGTTSNHIEEAITLTLQAADNEKLSETTFHEIVQKFLEHEKYEEACLLFQKIEYIKPPASYNLLARQLCDKNYVKEAIPILQEMNKLNIEFEMPTFVSLSNAIQQNPAYKPILKELRGIKMKSYNVTLRELLTKETMDDALELKKEMDNYGIKVDHGTMGVMLSSAFKRDDEKLVIELMKEMVAKKYPLNIVQLNVALRILCSKRLFSEALDLMNTVSVAVQPNDVSYTVLIDGFLKLGQLEEALQLYDEMKQKGFKPNVLIFDDLLAALKKKERLEDSYKLIEEANSLGIKLSPVAWNSVLMILSKQQKIDEAKKWLQDMRAQGVEPNLSTFHEFMNALLHNHLIDDAKQLLDYSINKMKLDLLAYEKVIKALLKTSRVEEAIKYLETMKYKPSKEVVRMAAEKVMEIKVNKELVQVVLHRCKQWKLEKTMLRLKDEYSL